MDLLRDDSVLSCCQQFAAGKTLTSQQTKCIVADNPALADANLHTAVPGEMMSFGLATRIHNKSIYFLIDHATAYAFGVETRERSTQSAMRFFYEVWQTLPQRRLQRIALGKLGEFDREKFALLPDDIDWVIVPGRSGFAQLFAETVHQTYAGHDFPEWLRQYNQQEKEAFPTFGQSPRVMWDTLNNLKYPQVK